MKTSGTLNTTANLQDSDTVYEALINAHEGLSDKDSAKLNAKLILFLINHIGDKQVILEAIDKSNSQSA
ncbi:MAG: DUF2783 domain-containing protein [Robiginitomaculum sp.]|nr:DUF2783 domain-containing protein [Robiginitomaculum sp.]